MQKLRRKIHTTLQKKYYCKGAVVKHQGKEKVATESMNDLVKVFFPLILKDMNMAKKKLREGLPW